MHNPDNLTADQIGDGFRLLTLEDVKANDAKREFRPEVECWLKPAGPWHKGCIGNKWTRKGNGPYTYRTREPMRTHRTSEIPQDPIEALKLAQEIANEIKDDAGSAGMENMLCDQLSGLLLEHIGEWVKLAQPKECPKCGDPVHYFDPVFEA